MDFYIVDSSTFDVAAVLDRYSSMIWTKRYFTYGDFELVVPADPSLLLYLKQDYFITRDDDPSVMVIEHIEVLTDAEAGDSFLISGRSLESILLRRIFYPQFLYSSTGSLAGAVQGLVTYCTTVADLSPGQENYRDIPGLYVDFSYSGTKNVDTQYTGETLLDGIVSLCKPEGVGIRMSIESGGGIKLELYKGSEVDVVFSPSFDNLLNSKYISDKKDFYNMFYVAGEGQGSARRWLRSIRGTFANRPKHLALRELYVDARDISSNDGAVSVNDYYDMLEAKADKAKAEHGLLESFEAEVETRVSFVYKRDYNLGDIVTVENEYGIAAHPRIVEITESWDASGYIAVPTFDVLEV